MNVCFHFVALRGGIYEPQSEAEALSGSEPAEWKATTEANEWKVLDTASSSCCDLNGGQAREGHGH